jgi:hypothetical protein
VVLPTVTNFAQAFVVSLTAGLVTLLSFIPALIGAILLVIIGWILSGWLARLVVALLTRVGFNTAADRTGVTGFMRQSGMQNPNAAWVLGEIVKWFIRLVFLEAAAQALQLHAVTTLITSVLLWIPNLIVALIVLMVGGLIARFARDVVRGAVAQGGFANADLLGTVAQFAIIGFALLVALNQIGVAASLINILFMAIVGALALAVGLAFGLGGRDVAGEITREWYEQRGQVGRLTSEASGPSAPAAPPPTSEEIVSGTRARSGRRTPPPPP